ncbi:hypothetical protein FDP41_006752 [Naegleria fowleri]|uniref:Fanconi Anaemia group E protein C-terminal domain-containing protein n=1 Tax=Naegleria fowleri TaxID=5763 RepID=A0A6A5BH59_NAEFO|nr:uncharacterized protein FDP41_006752 [Naegleria fowleri]KAF0974142.1 hypothetical protein FDP41_006752 [Naegleria fowleri]
MFWDTLKELIDRDHQLRLEAAKRKENGVVVISDDEEEDDHRFRHLDDGDDYGNVLIEYLNVQENQSIIYDTFISMLCRKVVDEDTTMNFKQCFTIPFIFTLNFKYQEILIYTIIKLHHKFKRKHISDLVNAFVIYSKNEKSPHTHLVILKQLFRKLCRKLNDSSLLELVESSVAVLPNHPKLAIAATNSLRDCVTSLYQTKTVFKRKSISQQGLSHTTITIDSDNKKRDLDEFVHIEENKEDEHDTITNENTLKKPKTNNAEITPTSDEPKVLSNDTPKELTSDQKKEISKFKKILERATNPKNIAIDLLISIINSAGSIEQLIQIFKELNVEKLNDSNLLHITQSLITKTGLVTSTKYLNHTIQCDIFVQKFFQPRVFSMKQKASRHLFSCLQHVCGNSDFTKIVIDRIILGLSTLQSEERSIQLSVDQVELITRMMDKILEVDDKIYLLRQVLENTENKRVVWNEEVTINILNRILETKNIASKLEPSILDLLLRQLEEIAKLFSKSLKFSLLIGTFINIISTSSGLSLLQSYYPSLKDIINQLENKMKDTLEKKLESARTQ